MSKKEMAKGKPRRVTLEVPTDHCERCDFLNKEGIRPDANNHTLVRPYKRGQKQEVVLKGYELVFAHHPADRCLNVWQIVETKKKLIMDSEVHEGFAGMWEIDGRWI